MNYDDIFKFYESKLDTEKTVKSLGWGSIEGQKIRFKKLIERMGFNESVLDVGCGYGDFFHYLKCYLLLHENNYCGIDIREDAITEARKRYSKGHFHIGDIEIINNKYDWIVASGIFCHPNENNHQYILKNIQKFYSLCNKGVSVNFLSQYSHNKNPEMYYADPLEIIKSVSEHITHKYILMTDYLPNDFTIILTRI